MFARSLARREPRARNMGEMIDRLGVEPGQSIDGGRILRSMAQSCLACRAGEECRDWLDARTGSLKAAPAFCPNADRFQEMLRH